MRSTCRRCGGRGSIITSPCVVCRGAGQAKQKKKVVIPVPAGGSGLLHEAICPCFWSRNSRRNHSLLRFRLHQLPLRSARVIGKRHLACLSCSCEKQLLHLLLSQGQRCTHCPPSWPAYDPHPPPQTSPVPGVVFAQGGMITSHTVEDSVAILRGQTLASSSSPSWSQPPIFLGSPLLPCCLQLPHPQGSLLEAFP